MKNIGKFGKVVRLYCTDCNSNTNHALAKPLSCDAQPTVFPKKEVNFRTFRKIAENSDVFTGKPPWWELHFNNVANLESISEILLKTDSTAEVSLHWFCKITFYQISENFLRDNINFLRATTILK